MKASKLFQGISVFRRGIINKSSTRRLKLVEILEKKQAYLRKKNIIKL
jgi:hypothetical protein